MKFSTDTHDTQKMNCKDLLALLPPPAGELAQNLVQTPFFFCLFMETSAVIMSN